MEVRVFHSFSFREALNASRCDCCGSCWCGPAASVSYGNGFRPDWLNKGGSMLEPIKYRWWRSHCRALEEAAALCTLSTQPAFQIRQYLLSLIFISYFLNCGNWLFSYLHVCNHINSSVCDDFKFRFRWMFALIYRHDEGILVKPGSKQTLKLSWHVLPEFFFSSSMNP